MTIRATLVQPPIEGKRLTVALRVLARQDVDDKGRGNRLRCVPEHVHDRAFEFAKPCHEVYSTDERSSTVSRS